MSSYIIEGGKKLRGEVSVSGSKNASLPIIASTILNGGTTKLYNIPDIRDTRITLEILKYLGCKVKKSHGKIEINTKNMSDKEIPEHLMSQMRSTVVLAGAILGRFKEATFSYPGGCDIGARPIDLHLSAFKKMGINIEENYGFITCKCDKIISADINLDFPSVGATENIILASCLGEGTTVITNAAREPEIEDMIKYLNKMGAKINGAGTDKVEIIGVKRLAEVSYNIMPDRIEAGTYLVAGAITSGDIKLLNVNSFHIEPILNKLEETNCKLNINKDEIEIIAPKRVKSVDIKTMPYPGFPTDMQSIFGALLITAKGTSVITENIFESRYKYAQELIRMGAKINVEGRTAIIKGTKKIQGTNVVATDLRGGAALVMAGLYAKGITQIDNIHYILRGYEKIDEKLKKLGAKIHVEK